MAQFPFTHADIMALAGSILAGLTDNPAVYPAPTVDLADFATGYAYSSSFEASNLPIRLVEAAVRSLALPPPT